LRACSTSQPVQHARPIILDQDIRPVHQVEQRRTVGLLLQVQHHRPLVAVPRHEGRALAVHEGRHRAGGVAGGRLDLDHLGAVVGQQHGAVRAGQMAGQVQHQQMIERASHVVRSFAKISGSMMA